MNSSSEYHFPIFISSPEYNLIDLRAELARYLCELGYRPILSSADGFPDRSPELQPWEACLPVLENCFVIVLIIDGRYGQKLKWPYYAKLFNEKDLSPTHGEYLYAQILKKRMLVFIREEIQSFYQIYRNGLKNLKPEETKETLKKLLPNYVDYETMEFVGEVKTQIPIPWIKTFKNVTDIKIEIQKKLLNELAEVFMLKDRHIDTVINAFNKVVDELTPEKKKEILGKINITKNISDLEIEIEEKNKELEQLKNNLENIDKGNKKEKEKAEKRIRELEEKILSLKQSSGPIYITDEGKLRLAPTGISGYSGIAAASLSGLTGIAAGSLSGLTGIATRSLSGLTVSSNKGKCSICGKLGNIPSVFDGFGGETLRRCNNCQKYFCETCWPKYSSMPTLICPKCTDAK